jgi:hypothetical protein
VLEFCCTCSRLLLAQCGRVSAPQRDRPVSGVVRTRSWGPRRPQFSSEIDADRSKSAREGTFRFRLTTAEFHSTSLLPPHPPPRTAPKMRDGSHRPRPCRSARASTGAWPRRANSPVRCHSLHCARYQLDGRIQCDRPVGDQASSNEATASVTADRSTIRTRRAPISIELAACTRSIR